MPGCQGCEFRDSEIQCWCLVSNGQAMCGYINGERGDEETREAYRKLIRQFTTGVVEDESLPPAPPPAIVIVEQNPTMSIQETVEMLRRINECPDHGEKIGVGCNCLHRCKRGYGKNGEVSFHDCQDCLNGKPYQIGV